MSIKKCIRHRHFIEDACRYQTRLGIFGFIVTEYFCETCGKNKRDIEPAFPLFFSLAPLCKGASDKGHNKRSRREGRSDDFPV